MSLVSVIIPNYNHAQYLGNAVDSVLNQAYPHYEIIVVDDGSTDHSREVAARFGNRIRYIWQENQGLSAARNTGIKAAQGEFISLLDADDMLEPEFLSTLVGILQANPGFDGVYCGYQFVDHLNRPLFQREARLIPPDRLYLALVDGNFLVPESMLARRQCYEAVGPYDESLRACEDWDIWLKMARRFCIAGVDKVLTRHRVLPGSMSSDPIRMLNNRLAVIGKHFGPEPANPDTATPLQRRAYGRSYLATAIEYLQFHDLERAYDCLHKMAVIQPELLVQLETYYELGFGDQPKGARGNFATLEVFKNAAIVQDLLAKIFADPQLANRIKGGKRSAFGQAYLALGLLSYGVRRFAAARHFLLKAIAANIHNLLNRQVMATLLKTLVGSLLFTKLAAESQEGLG